MGQSLNACIPTLAQGTGLAGSIDEQPQRAGARRPSCERQQRFADLSAGNIEGSKTTVVKYFGSYLFPGAKGDISTSKPIPHHAKIDYSEDHKCLVYTEFSDGSGKVSIQHGLVPKFYAITSNENGAGSVDIFDCIGESTHPKLGNAEIHKNQHVAFCLDSANGSYLTHTRTGSKRWRRV